MGSHTQDAVDAILKMLEDKEMDIFLAGPAFQAGRYGVACGTICKAVKERYHVPVVTSINVENPGVQMFKKDMYILKGGNIASRMRKDVAAVTRLANKILNGEEIDQSDCPSACVWPFGQGSGYHISDYRICSADDYRNCSK